MAAARKTGSGVLPPPSAQNLHKNPQILSGPGKRAANRPGIVRPMAKIIPIPVHRLRLPKRLRRDGWWLETPPARSNVIALPKRDAPNSRPSPKARHLTLVTSGK